VVVDEPLVEAVPAASDPPSTPAQMLAVICMTSVIGC
jgi:hypothetical protein